MSGGYRIFETDQFQDDLRQNSRSGHPKIVEKLRQVIYPQLRSHPHFGPHVRKLRDFQPETWRFRIGSWRFFCEIDEEEHVVLLTAASHRGSAY